MNLVFIPMTGELLEQFCGGTPYSGLAFATTPELYAALDYDQTMAEDAEYAALTYASVAALTIAPRRCVAVVETSASATTDSADDFGTVTVSGLEWDAVTALFIGDEEGLEPERQAALEIHNKPLAQAWDAPSVEHLLELSDLLWFGPQELDTVLALLAVK